MNKQPVEKQLHLGDRRWLGFTTFNATLDIQLAHEIEYQRDNTTA